MQQDSGWRILSRPQADQILKNLKILSFPDPLLFHCYAAFQPLTFLTDAYIVQLKLFSKQATAALPDMYFISHRDRFIHVSGDPRAFALFVKTVGLQLDGAGAAEYVIFFHTVVTRSAGLRFIASHHDLHILCSTGINGFGPELSQLLDVFEPPIVRHSSIDSIYRVRIDCLKGNDYCRAYFQICRDKTVKTENFSILFKGLSKITEKDKLPQGTTIIRVGVNRDLAPVIQILKKTVSGRTLLNVLSKSKIKIRSVLSHSHNFVFLQDAGEILNYFDASTAVTSIYEALLLARALRHLDQFLIGLPSLDPLSDPMALATQGHTKNLDAIVWVCRIAAELKTHDDMPDVLDVIDILGYSSIYSAVAGNKSEEEIFDAYANN